MDLVQTTGEWRQRGFYPILNREGMVQDRLNRSLISKMVDAGYRHNQPGFSREAVMPRYNHQCPATPQALDAYLQAAPAAGMPFGLPAISSADLNKLTAWVANDLPGPTQGELQLAGQVSDKATVAAWEAFLNHPDPRNGLVARYIFDHVSQASIVLEESPGDFFRIVRSATPATQTMMDATGKAITVELPIQVIDTPFPYSNPYEYAGVSQFWYRLQKVTEPRIQKNHFVWHLNKGSLAHLNELFLARDWDKTQDMNPPWGVGNPFLVYRAIPAEARSLFLLENAEVIVGGITYGPLCLGRTATYAVKDHLWVTAYKFPRFLPSVVLLRLNHGQVSRVYSLVANRVYMTQFDMLFQNGEALPDEDTMSVYPTIVGGFPNLFMELDLTQAPAFLKELRSVQTLEDWTALRNRYGILRNSERFWSSLDWFNDWNFKNRGEEAGYLDLSYYDLLDTVY